MRSIPYEYVLMIKCLICNKSFKMISASGHLRKHNISTQEYLSRFPDAELMSQSTKVALKKIINERVANGTHFVPFRDIKGFAKKITAKYTIGPVPFKCIRCGKIKKTNRYAAERRKFCSNNCHRRYIEEHPRLLLAFSKKVSKATTGIPKNGGYSRCNGGYRKDLGHYVRSGWEADVCRIFKYHNKPYEYECFIVRLPNRSKFITWIIDFIDPTNFLSQGLIEVKGWWDRKSKKKMKLLKQFRPDLYNQLAIIDAKRMKELVLQYRDVIPNWETRKKKEK